MKRERHIGPIKAGPGYEWPRDSQFVRNADAIRHYIGGGTVEVQQPDGEWSLREGELPTLGLFHLRTVRAARTGCTIVKG